MNWTNESKSQPTNKRCNKKAGCQPSQTGYRPQKASSRANWLSYRMYPDNRVFGMPLRV